MKAEQAKQLAKSNDNLLRTVYTRIADQAEEGKMGTSVGNLFGDFQSKEAKDKVAYSLEEDGYKVILRDGQITHISWE